MPINLKLEEFSDREFLYVLYDLQGTQGTVTSHDIAQRLKLDHEHPVQCVGARLAWLRRYGAVDQDKDGSWSLTESGERYTLGTLNASEQKMLNSMKEERLVDLVRAVTGRYRELPTTGVHLVRREWIYGTSKRRR